MLTIITHTLRPRPWWLAIALLFCTLLAYAQQLAPIPKLDSPVVDTTSTLTPAQKQQLEQQAVALQQRKGSQLQILVVPTTQPEEIAQYTQRVFDTWKLGREKVDDAVLIVVAVNDRRVRIQPGYGLEGAIPDITAGRIIQEYMVPKFRQNDYAGGIMDASAQIVKLIDGEQLPEPMTTQTGKSGGMGWIFALFAAFMAAQLARGLFSKSPAGIRGVISALVGGGTAWFFASVITGGIGAVMGLLIGLSSGGGGRNYRGGSGGSPWIGTGGGSWGGGGGWSGGSSGGGWSGGGGMSGGGGASGSW